MRRRDLVALAICPTPHAPVDEFKLNEFANQWNAYIEKLKNGQLDLKQWNRVVKAWERL